MASNSKFLCWSPLFFVIVMSMICTESDVKRSNVLVTCIFLNYLNYLNLICMFCSKSIPKIDRILIGPRATALETISNPNWRARTEPLDLLPLRYLGSKLYKTKLASFVLAFDSRGCSAFYFDLPVSSSHPRRTVFG